MARFMRAPAISALRLLLAVLSRGTVVSFHLGAAVSAQGSFGTLRWVTPALAAHSVTSDPWFLLDKPSLAPCVENMERPDPPLERDNP
jgi:hypothetical protein